MKRRELERQLRELGWRFFRHGAKHDIWCLGDAREAIPRHEDVHERLARMILRRAAARGQQ